MTVAAVESKDAAPVTSDATAEPVAPSNPEPSEAEQLAQQFGEWRKQSQATEDGKTEDTPSEPGEAEADKGTEAQEEDERETAEATPQPDEEEAPKLDAKRVDAARRALKRGNIPDELLADYPEDKLVEWGEKLAKAQADQDRAGNELAKYRRYHEQIEAGKREQAEASRKGVDKGEPDDSDTGDTTTEDAIDDADELFAKIDALEDDELFSEIAPLLKKLAQVRNAKRPDADAINEQVESLKQELAKRDEESRAHYVAQDKLNTRIAMSNPDLQRAYPELKDPKHLDAIYSRLHVLAKADADRVQFFHGDGTPDWDKLVETAAHFEFGGSKRNSIKQTQARMAEQAETVRQGQALPDSGKRQAKRSLSQKEAFAEAARLLEEGQDPLVIRRNLAGTSG